VFCEAKALKISEKKTKILANHQGLVKSQTRHNDFVTCGNFKFEIVPEFKYLGLWFDGRASEKCMIKHVIEKSRKAFHWLVSFVNTNGWYHPNIRVTLCEVYVRSLLQFGCNVWAPRLIM
jgi:hypothetical protein